MKFIKISVFAFYLLGLGLLAVPHSVLAQDTSQCCVCRSTNLPEIDPDQRSKFKSCEKGLSQSECSSKDVYIYGSYPAPGEPPQQKAISCGFEPCTVSNECPKPQAVQDKPGEFKFNPNISIPGSKQFQHSDAKGGGTAVTPGLLPEYIKALYKFFVGIAGILAVIMIAIGGLLWLFSGGDSGKITKAKELIMGAVVGLILVLTSYLILNTINSKLVNFSPLSNLYSIAKSTINSEWCDGVLVGDKYKGQQFECFQNCTEDALPTQTKCGSVYIAPGTNGLTCKGRGACGTGESCNVQRNEQGVLQYQCMDAAFACNRMLQDDLYKYDVFESGQAACDRVNIPGGAACIWANTKKSFDGFGGIANFLQNFVTAGGRLFYNPTALGVYNANRCYYYDQPQMIALCGGGKINACKDYNGQLGNMGNGLDEVLRSIDYYLQYLGTDNRLNYSENALRKAYCENDICKNARGESGVVLSCSYTSFGCKGDDRSDLSPIGLGQVEGWTFDNNIEIQKKDASNSLLALMDCLRTSLNQSEKETGKKIGKISSISDSRYTGNLAACNRAICATNPKCVHECQSCHYGGGTNDNRSFALDIGDQENKDQIDLAINYCKGLGLVGYSVWENGEDGNINHVHISTSNCPKN